MILLRQVEVLSSAIPPYIIVIHFTSLEKRVATHFILCQYAWSSYTTCVTVFKSGKRGGVWSLLNLSLFES